MERSSFAPKTPVPPPTTVKNAAQDALDQFNSLKARLAPLGDSFRGRTADKWDEKYTEWDTSAKDLMDALDGLGKFLHRVPPTPSSRPTPSSPVSSDRRP